MYVDQGVECFQKIFRTLGREKWDNFIKKVKAKSEKDDHRLIYFDAFVGVLLKFGINLPPA
jgi:Ca2+-binding EF-hand superfamily protein